MDRKMKNSVQGSSWFYTEAQVAPFPVQVCHNTQCGDDDGEEEEDDDDEEKEKKEEKMMMKKKKKGKDDDDEEEEGWRELAVVT